MAYKNHLALVDEDLIAGLNAFAPLPAMSDLPATRQAALAQLEKLPLPENSGVEIARQTIISRESGCPINIETYRPSFRGAPTPALLHMHGGGYMLGSPLSSRAKHIAMAAELGCFIASVDYRLAPETPYPGPLEDCYAALAWLVKTADALGVDHRKIAVAGDSAGGGLAAALALLARDRGEFRILYQSLTYPMIDDRTGLSSDPHPFTGQHVWTGTDNTLAWRAYLDMEPGGEIPPYAAVARTDDLRGLPPAYIAVGALDLFLEENMEYARRLTRAGVPVELHVYPGAYHGFLLATEADVAVQAHRDMIRALKRAFERSSAQV